ncbi:hypothetical protein GUJ93_ZPchr0002g25490 [Zizania palustris]|uniref:Uncharacterized protein n=1 Tax=Zizania palustris TaxID=103762 RepID=A0A8J5SP01_ZIZPA|nr:hypothetical protein GUJ93_ZPchr0002g25490 [Zizania palustris]
MAPCNTAPGERARAARQAWQGVLRSARLQASRLLAASLEPATGSLLTDVPALCGCAIRRPLDRRSASPSSKLKALRLRTEEDRGRRRRHGLMVRSE